MMICKYTVKLLATMVRIEFTEHERCSSSFALSDMHKETRRSLPALKFKPLFEIERTRTSSRSRLGIFGTYSKVPNNPNLSRPGD
jgi:hypothetical protein